MREKKSKVFEKDNIVWVDLGYSYGWWPAQYQVIKWVIFIKYSINIYDVTFTYFLKDEN